MLMGPKREDEYHDSARGKGEGCHVAAAALGRGTGQQSGYRTRSLPPLRGRSRHDMSTITARRPAREATWPAAPRALPPRHDRVGMVRYGLANGPRTAVHPRTRTAPRAHDRQRDGFCASSREQSINVAPIRHAVYPGPPPPPALRLGTSSGTLAVRVPPALTRPLPRPPTADATRDPRVPYGTLSRSTWPLSLRCGGLHCKRLITPKLRWVGCGVRVRVQAGASPSDPIASERKRGARAVVSSQPSREASKLVSRNTQVPKQAQPSTQIRKECRRSRASRDLLTFHRFCREGLEIECRPSASNDAGEHLRARCAARAAAVGDAHAAATSCTGHGVIRRRSDGALQVRDE